MIVTGFDTYEKDVKKRIKKNMERAEYSVFGEALHHVTPERTGDLIASQVFDTDTTRNGISMTIGYTVDYSKYVHDFTPYIDWTKASSDYQFLSNYFKFNKDFIFDEVMA